MEEYEKKHDHAVTEKETDIPKLTDLLLKVGTQQFLETLSPYITGGEILFDGEDGQTWKFTFDPENKSWQQISSCDERAAASSSASSVPPSVR